MAKTAASQIKILEIVAAKRDAALEELRRAFPHGRPAGNLGRGYDDRRTQFLELQKTTDLLALEIYELTEAEWQAAEPK